MARNELTQNGGINRRNATQVLILMRQSEQRQTSPTSEDILLACSSDETEKLRSLILSTLEAEGGLQLSLPNTNFSKHILWVYVS